MVFATCYNNNMDFDLPVSKYIIRGRVIVVCSLLIWYFGKNKFVFHHAHSSLHIGDEFNLRGLSSFFSFKNIDVLLIFERTITFITDPPRKLKRQYQKPTGKSFSQFFLFQPGPKPSFQARFQNPSFQHNCEK